eukprot:CAMPEP_0202695876 /NCGR_PEP_ID=MMETSP1385-20130828/9330_1 /ASSEMBLY_ACC=CAM_ASM_000861 /TAXON_ID=933848 /ORGANISM="Elphidium margaritaceum" /LENGTH=500 /DNA_ID=CAMNT_0049351955 /DNA_START=46 /DNA_END=1548 /DNA_ORIENTATION=-
MGREIVFVPVGQCGNQLGTVFWQTLCGEHHIDEKTGKYQPTKNPDDTKQEERDTQLHLEKIDVYFEETAKRRYVPRCVLVDLEPGVIETLKAKAIGSLFKPDNFVFGVNGGANNWAKTHYQDGPEFIDEILDVIRRSMESADSPQGIQVTQSLGGGTGSGLGSLIMLKLREHYPDRIISAFSVYPSAKVSDVVVEPYNATLTTSILIQDCDQVNVIDNEALYDISTNLLKTPSPNFHDLNWVVSLVMSGVTSSLRFPGTLNGDLRKMGVNLVPFPRLHFFTVSTAPLFSQNAAQANEHYTNLSVKEILDQLWTGNNFLAKINKNDGRFLSMSCIYRGAQLTSFEVEDQHRMAQDKFMEDFVNWIPSNMMTSIINTSTQYCKTNGSMIANFTGINAVFRRISRQFHKMFKKKAFLHWYIQVGMDEMEITEANKNVQDMIQEYQDKCDVIVDEDNPFERDADGATEQVIGFDDDDEEEQKEDDDGGVIDDDDDSDGIIQDSD